MVHISLVNFDFLIDVMATVDAPVHFRRALDAAQVMATRKKQTVVLVLVANSTGVLVQHGFSLRPTIIVASGCHFVGAIVNTANVSDRSAQLHVGLMLQLMLSRWGQLRRNPEPGAVR